MTDHPADQADSRSRRSAFVKIGAVAAGAWVAPQVLSTPAASAQSAPPCACPVAYVNAYNSTIPPVLYVMIAGYQAVPFDSEYLAPVGITANVNGSFTLLSAGTYRVTYTLNLKSGTGNFAVRQNGVTVSFTGLDLEPGQMLTRVVLVTADAGDVLRIANLGGSPALLGSSGFSDPCASILIELVA